MRQSPRTRFRLPRRSMHESGKSVIYIRMKRMEEKSEMLPTLVPLAMGMRKRYQLTCSEVPLRSIGEAVRTSAM